MIIIDGRIYDDLEQLPEDLDRQGYSSGQTENFARRNFGAGAGIFSSNDAFSQAAQKMNTAETLFEELTNLNTMRGGTKGFKGFVGESMEAARATAAGRATSVVNDNGPIDLIFTGSNGHQYPQQLKIGYKTGRHPIKFEKYKGQTVILDKEHPHFRQIVAEGRKYGVKVVEGSVTEAEAKWWADAMQLESKITGNKTSYFVPQAQKLANNLSAMHDAGLSVGKNSATYGAGYSIGSNIVRMVRGDVSAGEALGNVAIDTAISGSVGYVGGAVGSAVGRTVAGRAIASAAGAVGTAIQGTAIGGAVMGAAGTATAAIGGAATTAVSGALGAVGLAGTAVGAAAIAAAPAVAVGAVVGGIFSLLFDD